MDPTVELLNTLLATGALVALLAGAILWFDSRKKFDLKPLVKSYGLMVAFATTTGAALTSLLYSEVFGFVPCGLCWFQRVFLYPQAFIMGTALFYKDKAAARYGIVLSIPGLMVGLYQHYLQMGGSEIVACPTAGPGADCAKRIMFEYGFMTFPLMSAFLFIFLIALYVYILKTR